MKSIESIAEQAWYETKDDSARWKDSARAVLVHALTMIGVAGVSVQEAERRLRAGESIEAICEPPPKKKTEPRGLMYVCAVDCAECVIEDAPGQCKACGKDLKYQPIMSLNLLSNAHRNTCNRFIREKKRAIASAEDAKVRAEDRGAITDGDAFDAGPYPHPRSEGIIKATVDIERDEPSFSERAGRRGARSGA